MKGLFVRTTLVLGLAMGVLTVAGCAGKGEHHYLDLHTKQPAAQFADAESVKIVSGAGSDRRGPHDHGRSWRVSAQ